MLLVDELRDAWRAEPRDHRATLVAIVVIGVALRLAYLAQPMRYDESVTFMYFARLDWAAALSTYTYPNNHLFHTALVKAAVAVLGNDPWVLRLPALLAGIAVLPASYALTRGLYGSRAALVATAIVATSGGLVLYSTNARGYTLVVLAFLLLGLCGLRLLREADGNSWLLFSGIAALGLWTVPVMLFPLGTVALWVALSFLIQGSTSRLKRLGGALGIAGLLVALAYAPVISSEGLGAVTRNRFVAPAGWLEFFRTLPSSLTGALSSWTLGVPPLMILLLLLSAAVALRWHVRVATTTVGLPLAAFVWSCWLLVVTHRAPFARVWLWALPLVAALAGAGVGVLLDRWPGRTVLLRERFATFTLVLAIMLATSVSFSNAVPRSNDTGTYRDAAAAVDTLARLLQPGDRVVAAIPTNAPLHYYMHRAGLDSMYLLRSERAARRLIAVVDDAEGQRLADVVSRSPARDTSLFTAPRLLVRLPASALVLFQRRDVPAR